MKMLAFLGVALLAMGAVGLVGSFVVPKALLSKARMIQRIKPYDADTQTLTGDPGSPVGEPQLMVIDDDKAFLKGPDEGGAMLVNDDYLKSKHIYPLQVKTINFVANLIRRGAFAFALVGLALTLWCKKAGRARG